MPPFAWIALAVFVTGLAGGTAWAGAHALRAWRSARPSLKGLSRTASELSTTATDLEGRIAALERKIAELHRDAERLSVSLVRAGVLLGVVQEAKVLVDRVRAFAPKK